MIAVDTSALMAIILREPNWESYASALEDDAHILISASTVAEALIVAGRKGIGEEMAKLIAGLDLQVQTVTAAAADRVAGAYARWGKGVHPAGLNFGDCFAYEVAKENGCPLLYVGNDLGRTDIKPAVPREG